MTIPFYHIDAFTDKVFGGNPAGVCPLEQWLDDATMQHIAAENNLPATAFFVPTSTGFHIRWFSPSAELAVCGHGTLAASFVLLHYRNYAGNTIHFTSQGGEIDVTRINDWLTIELAADFVQPVALTEPMLAAFNIAPIEAHRGSRDLMLVFRNQTEIIDAIPNIDAILQLDTRGVIITASGDEIDFVSRFFAPRAGILEDPVTGSAHTSLIPYWSNRLAKEAMIARQLSQRGGYLKCRMNGERVEISGQAVLYSIGEIMLPTAP